MTLAARLGAGDVVYSGWSAVPDSVSAEFLAQSAFDAVTLDMQHGGHDESSVLRSMPGIVLAGKPPLVRIPVGRFDMASRALDFGAEAVIAPMVNSAADARAFAAAMKYPPVGGRSWGPAFAMPRRGGTSADWLENANGEALAFAMIETRAALDALDDILGVPGIDGVLVGPSDFSIAWTGGRVVDPKLEDMMGAIADIAARARAAGKHAAIFITDPAIVGRFVAMGYRLIAMGNEAIYFRLASQQMVDAAKASIG
jgi:4-hydroxy-2-oxoheptanedioate aldolase